MRKRKIAYLFCMILLMAFTLGGRTGLPPDWATGLGVTVWANPDEGLAGVYDIVRDKSDATSFYSTNLRTGQIINHKVIVKVSVPSGYEGTISDWVIKNMTPDSVPTKNWGKQ